MIKAEIFVGQSGDLTGFHISGHSGLASAGEDVLCAFVSSAAYMAANTVTDVIGADAEARAEDGDMTLEVKDKVGECQVVLRGLELHLRETEKQYPKNLSVRLRKVN